LGITVVYPMHIKKRKEKKTLFYHNSLCAPYTCLSSSTRNVHLHIVPSKTLQSIPTGKMFLAQQSYTIGK
jgi:hypothetical protein